MVSRWALAGMVLVATVVIGWATLGLALTDLVPVGLALAALALVADSAARREDVDATGYAGSTASLIQAFVVVLAVWAIWTYVDDPIGTALSYWWVFPLLVIGLFAYWYMQERRQVASSSTAVNRTQRTAKRTISSWTELVAGIVVLALTAVFAVATGVLDAFAPYAGELAYLGTVFLGYVNLGGSAGGEIASFIPSLTPTQWVGVTLFLGGLGLYIRYQS